MADSNSTDSMMTALPSLPPAAVLARRLESAREPLFDACTLLGVIALAPGDARADEPDWRRFARIVHKQVDDAVGLIEPEVLLKPAGGVAIANDVAAEGCSAELAAVADTVGRVAISLMQKADARTCEHAAVELVLIRDTLERIGRAVGLQASPGGVP